MSTQTTIRRAIVAGLLLIALSGCASLAGNAHYKYVRAPDGSCTMDIESGRSSEGPATADITDCNVKIGVGGLTQGESRIGEAGLILDKATSLIQAAKPTP